MRDGGYLYIPVSSETDVTSSGWVYICRGTPKQHLDPDEKGLDVGVSFLVFGVKGPLM